jgi:hypothetical protein
MADRQSLAQERREYGSSLSLKGMVDLTPKLQAVWAKINQGLDYPSLFTESFIEGEVRIELKVAPGGEIYGEQIEVHSESPVLQTYVLAIVLQALKEPFLQPPRFDEKPIPISLHFRFETYAMRGHPLKRTEGVWKNALHFNRQRYQEPKAVVMIKKYFPPLFPIPGGFIFDFVGAYRMIKRLMGPDQQVVNRRLIEKEMKIRRRSISHGRGQGSTPAPK